MEDGGTNAFDPIDCPCPECRHERHRREQERWERMRMEEDERMRRQVMRDPWIDMRMQNLAARNTKWG